MDSPFVQRLLVAAPELRTAYESHLRDNDELLPYVFMGDVTRMMIERCTDDTGDRFPILLLEFFERELSIGNTEASDLVSLGFCENLLGEDRARNILASDMGPLVFAAMKRVRAG